MSYENDKESQSEESEWKGKFISALTGLKKVTSTGIRKSEQLSRFAKHKVKRGLLQHERNKLFQELGAACFALMDSHEIDHVDLQKMHQHIHKINQSIEEETLALEVMKSSHESDELE